MSINTLSIDYLEDAVALDIIVFGHRALHGH